MQRDQSDQVTSDFARRCLRTRRELVGTVRNWLHCEALLLDARDFQEWLLLLADDIRYVMPVRANRSSRDIASEFVPSNGLAHFDETKASLARRVARLRSGTAWAEDPPSRTRHLVSNVLVAEAGSDHELEVRSCFLLYRSRGDETTDIFVGARLDRLRPANSEYGFQLMSRRIELDQATLSAASLSIFF